MAAKNCSFCGKSSKHLLKTAGTQAAEDKNISNKLNYTLCIHLRPSDFMWICYTCLNVVEKFFDLKKTVLLAIDKTSTSVIVADPSDYGRKSTMPFEKSSPAGPTPKRRRVSTIEQIVKSVEKLHVANIVDESSKKSKRKLDFLKMDHAYCSDLAQVGSATQKKSPRKPVSDYLSETLLPSKGQVNSDIECKKTIINSHLAALTRLSYNGVSVHFKRKPHSLASWDVGPILEEMKEHLPFLYQLLNLMVGNKGSKEGTIAMIYGMIIHSHNQHASLMQRLISTLLIKSNAGNKLMTRLNKFHLCLTADSKINLINEYGLFNSQQIVHAVSEGKNGKINGDNLDIFVRTNDIRMDNSNKDYHFFASDWTPFRLDEKDFIENSSVKEMINSERAADLTCDHFTVSKTEYDCFVENFAILLGRLMKDCCQHFKWLDAILPSHIDHSLSDIMARRTVSYRLPIALENEAKYEDCVHIMDSYEQQLVQWYNKANRGNEIQGLKVPVGGDQLTRVRLQGAKALRAGAHTPIERFENLSPVVVELFHTVMDFLEKITKKFMKSKSGRDVGTLENLRIRIHRSNVNGNVKSRYAAHHDFMMLAGKAYFLQYALTYFGMDSLNSSPTKHIPEGIERSHQPRRQKVFQNVFKELATYVVGKHSIEKPRIDLLVNNTEMSVPVIDDKITLNLRVGNASLQTVIPYKSLNKPLTINLPNNVKLAIKKKCPDDLLNYTSQFLHCYSILCSVQDAIAEGNIVMININLKMMIPIFFMHSELSKYYVECLDFILKTEHLLDAKLALQVRISSVVNPKGGKGQNKPADMEKENQVKELKKLIKGIGANKTERSIVQISKAAPVINTITTNFDCKVGFKNIITRHKPRSEEADLQCLTDYLCKIKPLHYTPNRQLMNYGGMKASVYEELSVKQDNFRRSLFNTLDRLKRDLPSEQNDSDSE